MVKLGRGHHTATHLVRIAPAAYWEALYPSKQGFNATAAASSLFQQQDAVGMFDPDQLRGRGVWIDDDRVVWNLGDRLEVDGVIKPHIDFEGEAKYDTKPRLGINPSIAPLTDAEGAAILALIHKGMQWYDQHDGLLLAGLTVLSNVGGALPYRPGLQLTGPSQGGKSTVIKGTIVPLQGDLGLMAVGTEAGVRQRLGSDSTPALIDESEQERP